MKITSFLTLILLFRFSATAQKMEMKWSDKMIYSNRTDGFFQGFKGHNSKNVITLFMDGREKVTKLIAFDKNTMKRNGEVIVADRNKPADKERYKGLEYYKTVVFENLICIFWKKENKEIEEIYVQSFSGDLKAKEKLKKAHEINQGRGMTKRAELFVVGNNKTSTIVIGGEQPGERGEKIKIEYKLLDSTFSKAKSGFISLPVEITERGDGLTNDYELGDDGNLHIKSYVRLSREERKKLARGESGFYSLYSIVNPYDGTLKSYAFKYDHMNIFNFDIKVDKQQIKVFGFFCDLNKDPRGEDNHGIFYARIDSKTMEMEKMRFSEFTKAQLDNLYNKDREDRNRAGLFAGKQKRASEEESLGSLYEIEKVESLGGDLVLFCSIMYNYSVRNCDTKGNCTYRYYCQKRNVTAFRINTEGGIVWASNLDRMVTYANWNIWDVKVINHDNKKFYVTYGSDYDDSDRKRMSSKKSRKEKRDILEYAVFDAETGAFQKHQHIVNAASTPRPDRKYVSALAIQELDNRFYINSHPKRTVNGQASSGCFSGGMTTTKNAPGYLGAINTLE